jgi:signal transduction histidine kinase
MRRKIGALALLAFGFIALVTIIIVSLQENFAVHNASTRVNRTYEVLHEIEITRGKYIEAFIIARNYLILDHQESLAKIPHIQSAISTQLNKLEKQTLDNSIQQKNLLELRLLSKEFTAALNHVVAEHKDNNLESLKKILRQYANMNLLSKVNQELAQIRNEELILLSMRQDKASSAAQYGLFAILMMAILIVILMSIFITLVRSYIKEKTESEENLIALTNNLKASNEQLQEFAMVVSHDLQEPLRKVQAFSERLKNESESVLNEKAKDYLARMLSSIIRMQNLISSLLTLSRVQTAGKQFEKVDLKTIVQEVLSDLETESEISQAIVEISNLPVIEADPIQMRQLFQNLISNALKYKKPDQQPLIKISAIGNSNNVRNSQRISSNLMAKIIVEDNGIGFDDQYKERIFGAFQRLHTKGEYSGTGIGLTVCKRIVERHNGKITAESIEGQGTKFIVTLPMGQIKGGTQIERS